MTNPGALASAMLSAAVAGRADPARFGRGRAYVRDGAVTSLEVTAGTLRGSVLGSRREPYDVVIVVPLLGDAADDGGAAGPGAGAAAVNRLVPKATELRATCSCPDDSVICKHAVAVALAFAQRVALDPDALGVWRGAAGSPGHVALDTTGPGEGARPARRPIAARHGPDRPNASEPGATTPEPPPPDPEVLAFLGDATAPLPQPGELGTAPLVSALVGTVDLRPVVEDALAVLRSIYGAGPPRSRRR